MTPMQRTALKSPCYFGMDTANPKFRCKTPDYSLILAIAAGYE